MLEFEEPGGVLLAHITNLHIALEPVFAALAADADMVAIGRSDREGTPAERAMEKSDSHWVVLSTSAERLDAIAAKNEVWHRLPRTPKQNVWTDDFADVLAAMRF